ncbi:HsdM family class I SAM-dependent methyltransferase [Rhodoplanes sp. Z2-YC6860]|uniref:HsdM family class I SAM-dependent methyltransferase n=1 Tax=Rhodoplanes sp. Z2-YC6860 TaxID=674703 RepID=UPI00078BF1F8|nr:N-6 DNA methylase [Rhodoplanes sp. Z2-YC6860]AMN39041.1 N-6 DNA methylase [Rhodoplanes sp. Z2-YC6860]
MTVTAQWLIDVGTAQADLPDGLIPVATFSPDGRPPEEVAVMEKAKAFGATAVFFEASRNHRPSTAQAFVFVSNGPADDETFGELHRRLWSWGGVPLAYRKTPGLVQLFRCAHNPDFVSKSGATVCKPYKTLQVAAAVSSDPWWDAARLRNGTLWDDPAVCKEMLSASKAAHKRLIEQVKELHDDLNEEQILKRHLRRKLLILCLLIAYLEERDVFPDGYFAHYVPKAKKFFEVLANGKALVKLLSNLEERFNGNVFTLRDEDADTLKGNAQLARFARLVEGREDKYGQLTLWQLYSFKDLPVELISHIYQLFVTDKDSSVYTPPFVVRLMLDEALSWNRLDRLAETEEVILDPSCGSGIFLVEAYKRLVLHWRSRNNWKRPNVTVLKGLLKRVHGVDLEEGAVELAAFSLCLALCDALEPEAIRASIKLFPALAGKTLHHSCFFEAKEKQLIDSPVGVVVGNPPFKSSLTTPGAESSYAAYEKKFGSLPDKQLAYLFLHEAMQMVAPGGVLSMLQQYNFLYNQNSLGFRQNFLKTWDVREVLDFISVRGLFQKGGADTKVIVVLAGAEAPPKDRKILHATFRRSGRADAEQGFDIDYYDLHWLPRELALSNDSIWRANLLGGGRVLTLVDRFKGMRSLAAYAESLGWDYGEGFIEGQKKVSRPAAHIVGKPLLPSEALTVDGIDTSEITVAAKKPIEGPRSEARFTPPMLLVREQMDLPHIVWEKSYLTYKNKIVGFAAPKEQLDKLKKVDQWLSREAAALRAFAAAVSVRLFTQKATTLSGADILALPYPEEGTLDLSENENIVIRDIVDYQRDLVRLGEDSAAMLLNGLKSVPSFAETFAAQINAIYKSPALKPLPPRSWPGVLCAPFVFGNGEVDWTDDEQLRGRLDALLQNKHGTDLHVTRIARIYDGNFIFLLKPDRLRYWLPSIALRDADETLSDLRAQGF